MNRRTCLALLPTTLSLGLVAPSAMATASSSPAVMPKGAPAQDLPPSTIQASPPCWWVGMKAPTLQLMLHGPGVARLQVRLGQKASSRVRLLASSHGDSANYLFVDLQIDPGTPAGPLPIELHDAQGLRHRLMYPLLAREAGSAQRKGFGPEDAIYLIVPDRFAKGERPEADLRQAQAEMREGERRIDPGGRHGGNLAGMRQHLDYIAAMGFTQIWPTPLTENNGAEYSYHGYAATDLYRIDPRFGSNEDYRGFVREAQAKGLGVIQDIVLNHIGGQHPWMQDLPLRDWVNHWPQYTETSHARMSLQDPYAAASDRERFASGWFTPNMPDLNQRQARVATYLIQNSIWWVEYAGLSGIRTDTYSYSERDFLARWSERLLQEYPRLTMVGEEWSPHPAVVSYWQRGKRNHDGYRSHMPSMMDFPLHGALLASLTEGDGHDSGFTKLYEALAHDFLYPDPARLVLFDGNHDTPRLFSSLRDDPALVKMAMSFIAVTRRIPQFFYGNELLLRSPTHRDDGLVRSDFPGGWPGDAVNGFTGQGLSAAQREVQAHLRRLLNWRKTCTTIHTGGMTHYSPAGGLYVLVRHDAKQRILLLMNKSPEDSPLPLARYPEMLRPGETAQEVLSGRSVPLDAAFRVPARSALILALQGAAPR